MMAPAVSHGLDCFFLGDILSGGVIGGEDVVGGFTLDAISNCKSFSLYPNARKKLVKDPSRASNERASTRSFLCSRSFCDNKSYEIFISIRITRGNKSIARKETAHWATVTSGRV